MFFPWILSSSKLPHLVETELRRGTHHFLLFPQMGLCLAGHTQLRETGETQSLFMATVYVQLMVTNEHKHGGSQPQKSLLLQFQKTKVQNCCVLKLYSLWRLWGGSILASSDPPYLQVFNDLWLKKLQSLPLSSYGHSLLSVSILCFLLLKTPVTRFRGHLDIPGWSHFEIP